MDARLSKAEQKHVKDLTIAVNALKKMQQRPNTAKKTAEYYGSSGGVFRPLFSTGFNGEKNLGEIGPIRKYILDYEALRLRSWQSYLESEITQTIIGKFIMWVIGNGLKLQSEPATDVLKEDGYVLDKETFSKQVEGRYGLFTSSENSDWAGMDNVNILSSVAYKNAILGGDCLVVLRLDADNQIKVQLIDGTHVQSPMYGSELFAQVLANGNRIIEGIELNPRGEHVAYYVRQYTIPQASPFSVERILAKGTQTGLTMAFMVYGLKYRLDNHRGMPLIGVILETLKKLERYKEATVGSAEERQKIAFFITHNTGSTGENPIGRDLARALSINDDTNDIPVDVQGREMANLVAATTNKTAFNMPIESDIKSLGPDSAELSFKDFYTTNINLVCSALNIPPDVAMSMYNSSYSASRAAIKDWEHTLSVKRYQFANQFDQKIFNFWLEVNISLNKVNAPGYLKAKNRGDIMSLEAFRKARWVGAQVPHIDPVKEVTAERLKLGITGAALPLTTAERSAEILGGGEYSAVVEQYANELQKANDLGITIPVAPVSEPKSPTEAKKKKKIK